MEHTQTVRVDTYSDEFHDDIVKIVENFYEESIQCYDIGLDKDTLVKAMKNIKANNSGNAFLLIIDEKCEGLLAGIEVPSLLNKRRKFQELVWYVNKPFRMHGVSLLRKAQEILKADGFDAMIMGVLEVSKADKIKRFYETMGFKLFESQYIKEI